MVLIILMLLEIMIMIIMIVLILPDDSVTQLVHHLLQPDVLQALESDHCQR